MLALLFCPSLSLAQVMSGNAKPTDASEECGVPIGEDVAAFRRATAELPSDPSVAEVECRSATDAPICVFKTWTACEYWQEPQWCAAVGVADVKFNSQDSPVNAATVPKPKAPWLLNLHDPEIRKVLGRVIGLREVERDRCYLDIPRVGAGVSAAKHFLGNIELMYLLPSIETGQEDVREQIFVRKLGQRWQLTGWQGWDDTSACIFSGYEDDAYFGPICKLYADVHPWALRSELTASRARSGAKP